MGTFEVTYIDEIIEIIESKSSFSIIRNNDSITKGISIDFDNNVIQISPHIPTQSSNWINEEEIPRLDNFQYYCIFLIFKKFKNRCNYVINQMDECFPLELIIKDIYGLQSKCNISTDNILFKGSDFYAHKNIIKYSESFETPLYRYIPSWNLVNHCGIHLIPTAEKYFYNNVVKKYKSTLLLARDDVYRYEFVIKLFDSGYYDTKSIISTFANRKSADDNKEVIDFYKLFIEKNNYSKKYLSDEFFSKTRFGNHLGKAVPMDGIQSRHMPFDNDSYLWITSESLIDVSDVMFITEKVLKSYMWYKPMVVFSSPHTLSILRELGFLDVFEKMGFDSSYDSILNYKERLNFIVNQIKLFNDTPLEEIHKRYNSEPVQSALLHNNLLFKKLIDDDIVYNGMASYSEKIYKLTGRHMNNMQKDIDLNTDVLSFYKKILNI